MKKQITCMVLVLALLIALLAGCGGAASSAPETSEAAGSAQSAEAAQEPETAQAEPAAEPEAGSAAEGSAVEAEPAEAETVGSYGYPQTPYDLPLTDEDVTFTMFAPMSTLWSNHMQDLEENRVFQELEKRTGVKMDITTINQDSYVDQLMLMIAAGDWTDLMVQLGVSYPGGMAAAMEQEVVLDLAPYAEYMPNYMACIEANPSVFRDVTLGEGEVCAVYRLFDEPMPIDSGLLIRGDWLDNLGLESPKTVDQFYDVMTAFHNEYGAYIYLPKSGLLTNQAIVSAYDVRCEFVDAGFFTVLGCFYPVDGVVKCGFYEEGFKTYLELMHKMFVEGLIDPDFMSSTNAIGLLGIDSAAISDLLNDKIGCWSDHYNNLVFYDSTNAVDPNFRVDPLAFPTLEEGDTIKSAGYRTSLEVAQYSVSPNCDDIELLCQWMDYSFTDEGIELNNWGFEGETFERTPDGNVYTDLILDHPEYNTEEAKGIYLGIGGYLHVMDAYLTSYSDLAIECMEIWSSNMTGEHAMSDQLVMTTEESARYSELVGDVITYLYESIAKFITGDMSLETEYDGFIDNLHKLNMDEMVEIEQAMYDRWANK